MGMDWITPLLEGTKKGASSAYDFSLYKEDKTKKQAVAALKNEREKRDFWSGFIGTLDKSGQVLNPADATSLYSTAFSNATGMDLKTPYENVEKRMLKDGLGRAELASIYQTLNPNATPKEENSFVNTWYGKSLDKLKLNLDLYEKQEKKTFSGLGVSQKRQFEKDARKESENIARRVDLDLAKQDKDFDEYLYKYNPTQQDVDLYADAARALLRGDENLYQQELEKAKLKDQNIVIDQIKLLISQGKSDRKIRRKLKKNGINHYEYYYRQLPTIREEVANESGGTKLLISERHANKSKLKKTLQQKTTVQAEVDRQISKGIDKIIIQKYIEEAKQTLTLKLSDQNLSEEDRNKYQEALNNINNVQY